MPIISTGWLVAGILAVTLNIVFPIILTVIVARRLHERFRFVLYGALIFFLFQLVTRVPLVLVGQNVLATMLEQSAALRWIWLIVLSLTAGLFEEIGRYIGYRWLMRNDAKSWAQGVLYGLGHGACESVLLVGGLGALSMINIFVLSQLDLASLSLTSEQQQLVAEQLSTVAAQPWWYPLLASWERIWAIAFHVALSLVVLQVFWRGEQRWLWVAIAAHFLFNFVSLALLTLGLSQPMVEVVIAAVGLLALRVIFMLRPASAAAPGAGTPVST